MSTGHNFRKVKYEPLLALATFKSSNKPSSRPSPSPSLQPSHRAQNTIPHIQPTWSTPTYRGLAQMWQEETKYPKTVNCFPYRSGTKFVLNRVRNQKLEMWRVAHEEPTRSPRPRFRFNWIFAEFDTYSPSPIGAIQYIAH